VSKTNRSVNKVKNTECFLVFSRYAFFCCLRLFIQQGLIHNFQTSKEPIYSFSNTKVCCRSKNKVEIHVRFLEIHMEFYYILVRDIVRRYCTYITKLLNKTFSCSPGNKYQWYFKSYLTKMLCGHCISALIAV